MNNKYGTTTISITTPSMLFFHMVVNRRVPIDMKLSCGRCSRSNFVTDHNVMIFHKEHNVC